MRMYEKFVKAVSFPLIARTNGLDGLLLALKRLDESQYWSLDRLMDFELRKLKVLLKHCYEQTAFYKKRFDDAGFNPYTINSVDELKKLPVLTKDDVRKNILELVARNVKPKDLHESETGGTTGVKMRFFRDNACLTAKQAALLRFEKWSGWEIGERVGIVWPASSDYVGHHTWKAKLKNELYERQVSFAAAVLNDDSIGKYFNQLSKKKPTLIRGFPSPLYEIGKFILERGIGIEAKGVISTGEPLFEHQREVIRNAFKCEVLDSYRTREAGPVAQQCQELGGLHLNWECVYVETESAKDLKGEAGYIVITDLENYGMPLIRYYIGDIGSISFKSCPCGRGLPLLESICGRTADNFMTLDGKRIMAVTLVLYLVDNAPGLLGQVQIIQDRLDHIAIRMTPDPLPTEEIKAYQKRKIEELFGPEMTVSFEIVDSIPREASGKYAFTICKINEQFKG